MWDVLRRIEGQTSCRKNKCAGISIALTSDHNHPCLPTHTDFVTFLTVYLLPLPPALFFFHTSVNLATCLMYGIVLETINKCAWGEVITELTVCRLDLLAGKLYSLCNCQSEDAARAPTRTRRSTSWQEWQPVVSCGADSFINMSLLKSPQIPLPLGNQMSINTFQTLLYIMSAFRKCFFRLFFIFYSLYLNDRITRWSFEKRFVI